MIANPPSSPAAPTAASAAKRSPLAAKAKLNIGLVGAGRMGIAYARYLANRVPGSTLYAVSDVRLAAAEAARDECGAAKAYADFNDLLNDKAVDAVVVMTPTKLHKEVVLAAAGAGKPIFCENRFRSDSTTPWL